MALSESPPEQNTGTDEAQLATDSGSLPASNDTVFDATQYFSVNSNLPTEYSIRPRPQMHNSQCLWDGFNTYLDYPSGGNTVSLWTSFYFFSAFSGQKQVWTRTGTGAWMNPATWTVPSPEQTTANVTVTSPTNNSSVTASVGITVTGTVTFTAGQSGGIVLVYWDGPDGAGGPGTATISGNNFTFSTGALPTTGTYIVTVLTAADQSLPGGNQTANLVGAVAPRITVTAQ